MADVQTGWLTVATVIDIHQPKGSKMNTMQLTEMVAKKTGVTPQDAERTVRMVLDSLRESKHSTMIFRKTEEHDVPMEQRKTIYLCG